MKIHGKQLFDGKGQDLGPGVLEVSPNGQIQAIELGETAADRSFDFLCPGFINSHCHLELSHLKGVIPKKTGLPGFIQHVQKYRSSSASDMIRMSCYAANYAMVSNGIVGVGDISNGSSSLPSKKSTPLAYHTFVESFGFDPNQAEQVFASNQNMVDAYENQDLSASGTPHAPYSCSLELIQRFGETDGPFSIHMEETKGEVDMFLDGKGPLMGQLESMGVDFSTWKSPNKSSLKTVLPLFPKTAKIMLVHGTFTSKHELKWVKQGWPNAVFCACPNANMYIEGRLPDYPEFVEAGLKMVIGTDSLASNDDLDVWSEIESIQTVFSEFEIKDLISWACGNAADFFGWDHLGSLEVGKKPGILGWNDGERPKRVG